LGQFKVSTIGKVRQGNWTQCSSDSIVSEVFSGSTINPVEEFQSTHH
jgi:hypothetical protein